VFWRVQQAFDAGVGLTDLALNELSDAVLPESLPARRFDQDVKRMLAQKRHDAELNAGIRARLTAWKGNHAEFEKVAAGSFLLDKAIAVSSELQALAEVGLEAVDAFEARKAPDRGWLAKARALIAKQKRVTAQPNGIAGSFQVPPPQEGLVIAIVPAIEALVDGLISMVPGQ
jgi:hypothetical protein